MPHVQAARLRSGRVALTRGVVAATLLSAALFTSAIAGAPDSTSNVMPWAKPTTWDIELASPSEPGPRFVMSGTVLGKDSLPASGVKLYVYHADTEGQYARKGQRFNRLAGVLKTSKSGEYRIRSIMPGMYSGPGHVHFEVWSGDRPKSTIAVSLYAAPGVPPVPTWKHTSTAIEEWKPTMALFELDSSGVYRCHHDLRLETMRPTDPRYDAWVRDTRREVEADRRQSR